MVSSLQCPATLLLSPCDTTTPPEILRERAGAVAARLASRRVAALWTARAGSAHGSAESVAERLGCRVTVRVELDAGDVDETGPAAADRLRGVLQEAADLHRGEAVLLLVDAVLLRTALPRLAAGLHGGPDLEAGEVVELEVDEEWRLLARDGDDPRTQDGDASS